MAHLTLSATTRSYPDHPYESIASAILSASYQLSLVFVGATRAKTLNQTARGKSYVPDVLSFPLHNTTGEIYICLPRAYAQAATYGHTQKDHVAFLFIHGLLHLKGYEHGATMERAERRFCARFGLCS